MTKDEKRAMIQKNLEADPALRAEYEALTALLPSPEEAEQKLAADPALRERYNAVMAKATRGVELDEDELGSVTGGRFSFILLPGMLNHVPQVSDLVYRPGASGSNSAGKVTLL